MKRFVKFIILSIVAIVLLSIIKSPSSEAFNANSIISDGVFNNSSTMSAAQIDSFLNSFASSCISPANGFADKEPIGYTPSAGFTYGGNVSAGKIIYNVSKVYGLNPQVILSTLQKEQSLVTGSAGCYPNTPDPNNTFQCNLWGTGNIPCTSACPYNGGCINIAVGNNCPGNCQASSEGFSKQLVGATWKLKYWQQRSEGNVGWNAQARDFPYPGNIWDNSDDVTPGSFSYCYSGLRMTQGFFKLCPNGASATYDGLTTINNNSLTVHLDNGATAALYNYTPFTSGNISFDNIFQQWFGSLDYREPLGGTLYYQQSTNQIFLVTTDNNTRYYVSSWAMMQNYKLDGYQIIPADDATIQQYTDGGPLTSLVWDSNGVFLVNNGIKYHVPGGLCSEWGFACADGNATKQLGSTFQSIFLQNGTELYNLASYGSTYYKMQAGSRLPIANSQTLKDLGYAPNQALALSDANVSQPLGGLLLTTPTPIKFGNGIYYFNGIDYHWIPDNSYLSAWGISNIFTPPASSYDSSPPPLAANLSKWYVGADGSKYLVDHGYRILLNAQQQQLWPSAVYQSFSSPMAEALPVINMGQFVWSNPKVYMISGGQKHYIPTYSDYLALGVNSSSVTSVDPSIMDIAPLGSDALGDGKLIGVGSKIYVVNNHKLLHIPDSVVFGAFGFDWGAIYSYPSTILNDYPEDSAQLRAVKLTDGSYSYILNGYRIALSSSMAGAYGLLTSGFTEVSSLVSKHMSTAIPLSKFMQNVEDGKIYYASGGAIHYVSSYQSFVGYGGLSIPTHLVDSTFLSNFTVGQPV